MAKPEPESLWEIEPSYPPHSPTYAESCAISRGKPCKHKGHYFLSGNPIRWYHDIDWLGSIYLYSVIGFVIFSIVFIIWNIV